MTTLTNSTVSLYAKKVSASRLLATNTAGKKIGFWQDSNGTFAPTAKTGYKLVDFGFSQGVQYSSSRYVWVSNEDARLQPHDSINVDNLNNGLQQFRYAYIPNEVPSTPFKQWFLGKGRPLYHYILPDEFHQPIYINDHNFRTPIYQPKNKR